MTTLEQFEILKEVAETGNITKASKRLHISQPSVSVQIQNLEKEYGVPLFLRTNRGVTLTPAGEMLYKNAVIVLNIVEKAKSGIRAFSQHQNQSIHVGATMTIGEYILPRLMALEPADDTTPQFNARIANTRDIVQGILSGELSLGMVEGPVAPDKDLMVEQFWSDELVIIVPKRHAWSSRTEISFEELVTEHFITREEGSGTRKTVELSLERSGFDPAALEVAMELNSTQAIKGAVMAGLGVAIISALTVQEECQQGSLSMLRLHGCQLTRPLNVITYREAVFTPEERWFLDQVCCKELIASLLPAPYLPADGLVGGE